MTALKLDSLDLKILSILQDEGRLPGTTIALRTGLSESQCAERIFRLERDGHIGGYTIIRNYPDADTRPLTALIRIAQMPGRTGHDLQRSLEFIPEITTAELVDTNQTVLLRLQVPDLDRLGKIITFFESQSAVLTVEVSTTHLLFSHRPTPQTIGS